MSLSAIEANARDLEQELSWFVALLDARFSAYFAEGPTAPAAGAIEPPDLAGSESSYATLVRRSALAEAERVALVLALVPHLRPELLDIFFTKNSVFDRRFTEFGGEWDVSGGGFTPTGETLQFVLAGGDLSDRFWVASMLAPELPLVGRGILRLESDGLGVTSMTSRLVPSDDVVSMVTTGRLRRPQFGADFPARLITTELSWDDLVLHPGTRRQIGEIETWVRHGDTLMNEWGMAAKLRPGHRVLFHGSPGTGKTMTASLLGKYTDRDVYKVDLSLVVSKYIGETEKNLGRVFDSAQNKQWILFFDEADALFGKRSETKDAHDRYANQEVSYLLQRIESFDGIALLASNRRDDLDDAFTRRFEAVIHFPIPRAEERLRLWNQAFSPKSTLAAEIDLERIAREHALTGGNIMNVVRFASLDALDAGTSVISDDALRRGIRRELSKDGQRT